MARRVNVIGVGMTKFAKPGQSEDYHVMASKAARADGLSAAAAGSSFSHESSSSPSQGE